MLKGQHLVRGNPDKRWMSRALCKGRDPDSKIFYCERFHGDDGRAAKAICEAGCPVKTECLEYALATEPPGFRYGIWGGKSPKERHRLAGTYAKNDKARA